MDNFAVAIFGPTGIGKTALSLSLAQRQGEIISVDSRQVYKYLNIGTAKPTEKELSQVPHHLIDIITPDKQFTAGQFIDRAELLIPQIYARGNIPYLVGGTGLYFNSLINGIADIKISSEAKELANKKWEEFGQERFYKILQRVDPQYATKIHQNDKQRTIRALEVFLGTGKRFTTLHKSETRKSPFKYIKIGLNIERELLYDRINRRVDQMISDGLIEEVENLLKMGYDREAPGMRTIGYKEIADYFDKKHSKEDAISEIKKNSRRYAKRQLTWFRKIEGVRWFGNDEYDRVEEYIKRESAL